MSNETNQPIGYILGETEVKLTGRKATRQGPGTRINEIVEVTPMNEDEGTWKKWVQQSLLFKIES